MNQETTIRNTYMIEIDNEVNGFRLGTLKYGREKLVLEGQKKLSNLSLEQRIKLKMMMVMTTRPCAYSMNTSNQIIGVYNAKPRSLKTGEKMKIINGRETGVTLMIKCFYK